MTDRFLKTHKKYEIATSGQDDYMYQLLKKELGDTDLFSKLETRPWFTFPHGEVYIRNDIKEPDFIIWGLLHNK